MKNLIDKAEVLVDALPFIQKFRNTIMLVKFGGSSMEDPELVRGTMKDIVMLEAIGVRPIVVHGGGKAISAELKKRDIPVKFVNGLRYTCDRTIGIVDEVLHSVNAELVKLGTDAGGRLRGISGKKVLKAQKTGAPDPVTGEMADVGFVGQVVGVNVTAICDALNAGEIPVITPLGLGYNGETYNINADTAACEIAKALHVRKLVFMSDVPGILANKDDETSVISTISTNDIPELIKNGILSGGMLPKIASCVEALDAGINKVHMIDGRLRHSLLLEIFTGSGVGTEILRPDSIM